jgi:hypothetical protein
MPELDETKPLICGNGSHTIVAVGDSITYGYGVAEERDIASYPAKLVEFLGDDFRSVNFGICGATALARSDRPYTATQFYRDSLNAPGDLLLFMLGTNDSKGLCWHPGAFRYEYKRLLEQYIAAVPTRKVVLMLPPKVFLTVKDKFCCNDFIIKYEIPHIVNSIAAELSLPVIDLYSLTENRPDWFPDAVHPNVAGNKAIAEYIGENLRAKGI